MPKSSYANGTRNHADRYDCKHKNIALQTKGTNLTDKPRANSINDQLGAMGKSQPRLEQTLEENRKATFRLPRTSTTSSATLVLYE
ncbi:hypothetical protein [Pseudomonas sp. R5-89-07]|uniref:hypothetical protein n=1 Tax=Pseudomonas sp. R5-89-07 TaxID=658644 RepID=UPI000F5678BF|nr:hypothetical protein [Pseudomonas sp. R5-89-07]